MRILVNEEIVIKINRPGFALNIMDLYIFKEIVYNIFGKSITYGPPPVCDRAYTGCTGTYYFLVPNTGRCTLREKNAWVYT